MATYMHRGLLMRTLGYEPVFPLFTRYNKSKDSGINVND